VRPPTPSVETYRRILGLRAIRAYRPRPVSTDDLQAILEAGRWTGSSKNTQRWVFIVIEDRDGLDALATAGDFTAPMRSAPLGIALVRLPGGNDFDIGRVAQNIMLAAAARGVASCPITLHREERAREILHVPADHGCRWAIALGYPDEALLPHQIRATRERGMSGRKPLAEITRRESFDDRR
jgi:nitroreductase